VTLGGLRGEIDHPRGDRRVGAAIAQDESAGVAVVRVSIKADGSRDRQIAYADLAQI
jgi:hypothetical protein